MMTFAKVISWIALLAMTIALLNGFISGNFGQDGGALLTNPWGIVSIVDLYAGFALFSLWIAFREDSFFSAALWIIFLMVLGFFAGSLYVLIMLYKSDGDWLRFFLGSKKENLLNKSK
jgi:hypothetical protein